MEQSEAFWQLVRDHAAQAARAALPPFIAYARTTGDASTTEVVEGVTTTQVTVWLGGMTENADNKVTVVLPFGSSDPAAGELWLVLLPNFAAPGVLLLRLA